MLTSDGEEKHRQGDVCTEDFMLQAWCQRSKAESQGFLSLLQIFSVANCVATLVLVNVMIQLHVNAIFPPGNMLARQE